MLTLCAVFAACRGQSKVLEIYSNPVSEPGGELQLALPAGLRSLESDMTLLIHKGAHMLPELTLIRDISDVTLLGNGPAEEVVITCAAGVGLAFFNLVNFQVRNLTIDGCGLNQGRWDPIYPLLNRTFDIMIEIPRVVSVGIIIVVCRDVTLENLEVRHTQGIGLLAVSPLGSSQLRNVQFQNNVPPSCPPKLFNSNDHATWIGGGAYFLYQDLRRPMVAMRHSLTVEGGTFTDNQDCSITVLLESFLEHSMELAELGYQVGAGGGLTVMMAQTRFAVAVSVTDSRFENNAARNGGGLHVGVFSGIPSPTTILVAQCTFVNNGRKPSIVTSGGGMIVNIGLIRPSQVRGELVIPDAVGGVLIDVQHSMFGNNMARTGGGAAIASYYAEQHIFDSTYRVNFHKCRFGNNQGIGGSALLVYETKSSGFEPGLQVAISDSTFTENSRMNNDLQVGTTQDYGVLHVRNVNVTLSGNNLFTRNAAPALGAVASLVNVIDLATFERNKAVNGAGMQLLSRTLLILHRNAHLRFISNRAELTGGAIFVQDTNNFTLTPDDCFLYFNEPGYALCTNAAICLPDNVTVEFTGNGARLGSLVFGSALTTCPWLPTLMQSSPEFDAMGNVYENLQNYHNTFIFEHKDSALLFSTPAARLRAEKHLNISVMPGEQFFVDMMALDDFNNDVPQVITSNVVGKGEEESTSVIGDFGFFELRPRLQMFAPITVYSEENINVTIRLTTIDLEAEMMLNVRLTSCVVGFNHSDRQCVCDERLISRVISCDTNFTVGHNSWLGPVHARSNTTNNDLTVTTCLLNYCKDGSKEVVSGEWDSQCREDFHRAGRLCGRCEDGYSLQLGTNACAKCTNWYLFLLVFFLLAGFFVVFLTTLLQFSVAEGFFVAVLFYSNIVTLFAVYFNDNEITGINFLTAFFSLNFGIPSCFYDGMDSLALSALQLAFVAYLFILALLHILFDGRVYLKFVDTVHQRYSPSKTFATLIIQSYVSLLQYSFGVLSFTVVSSFDGNQHVFWYTDPSVDYFTGFHIILGIIAIVLFFVFLIPAPILFTFYPRAIYRWPYFNKLKPLYDALYAPFKPQFRSWLGFQLIFRIVLFIIAHFVPTPHHLLAASICLLLYLHLQTRFQPYIAEWANHLESTLIVNALFYMVVTLYFGNLSSVSDLSVILSVIILAVFADCFIVIAFIRHIIERNPKMCKRIKSAFKRSRGDKELASPVTPTIRVLDSVGNDVSDTLQHRAVSVDYLNSIPDREKKRMGQEFEVSYTEYREPLLDEGDLDIHTSYSVVISSNSNASGSPRHSPPRPQHRLLQANSQTTAALDVDSFISRNTA